MLVTRNLCLRVRIISKYLLPVIFLSSIQISLTEAQETSAESSIEEVIVYGIRKSLESALAEKRDKMNLTEIINADDIGKLPDENIAEVLENIPGVQITRSGGIGQSVSIRGSDQNRVEINGRGTTSSGDERGGISFSDLPASLVRSLNVIKVPTADMVEGSIGGTINVKTYRGLKLKQPLKVTRYSSEYAENSDSWNDNFSLTLGNKFETEFGDIGAMATLSHIDKTVREDVLEVRVGTRVGWGNTRAAKSTLDFDGDGVFDPYYKPGYGTVNFGLQDRTNTAFSGSLEWQATPGLKFFLEGAFTDTENFGRDQTAQLGLNGSDIELNDLDSATFDVLSIAGLPVGFMTSGLIGAGVDDGLVIKTRNGSNTRDTQTFLGAIGGEWDNDDWLVEFEVTSAGADTDDYLFQTVFQFNDPSSVDYLNEDGALRIPFFYDIRDGELSYGPIDDIYRSSDSSINPLLDEDYYVLSKVKDTDVYYKNREDTQRLDITRILDIDFLPYFSSIKFGYRASKRTNFRKKYSQQMTWDPILGTSEVLGVSQFNQSFVGSDFSDYLISSPGDFFDFNTDGLYLDNFLTMDGYAVASQQSDLRTQLGLNPSGVLNPYQGFTVRERTKAAYFMLEYFNDSLLIPAKGNIGVRFVDTNQFVSGYNTSVFAEYDPNDSSWNDACITSNIDANGDPIDPNDPNPPPPANDGLDIRSCSSSLPINVSQDYSNVLPSASLILSPTEKLQLRFGYAEILRRPNFSQISPTVNFPLTTSPSVRIGVPELRPTTAEQYDFSLEYYFRKGSVLSIGLYRKDLHGVIGTESTGQVCNPLADSTESNDQRCELDGTIGFLQSSQSPVNLPGGEINGYEIAFQHNFTHLPRPFDGLGIIANYAYQDGERDQEFNLPRYFHGGQFIPARCAAQYDDLELREICENGTFPLNFVRLSENSYNVTLFFERPRYRWSGRLRYTYRDSYLIAESSDLGFGQPSYADDRGQLNASMSYRIDDVFSLTFSGVNLTKEVGKNMVSFANGPVALQKDADRRFALGIRARF